MNIQKRELKSHEDFLEEVAKAIDIPEEMHQIAVEKYNAISQWLARDGSTIKQYSPEIYQQGSFLLGTVTRPIGDKDEYDIDLVCKLEKVSKQDCSMEALKQAVGNEIISYTNACNVQDPEDKRRCWTIDYQSNFHMDILPSLPDVDAYSILAERLDPKLMSDERVSKEAIAITDKKHPHYKNLCDDWLVSNPIGYKIWFDSRQSNAVFERKTAIMESAAGVYESIDDVSNYSAKTPLQRSIQLLKRHRDAIFQDDEDKPISMIITTLAAHAYGNQSSIVDSITSILEGMHLGIAEKGGEKWVVNPVNPEENFADKWKEEKQKEEKFYSWLDRARRDFGIYLKGSHYNQVPKELQESLSNNTVMKVLSTTGFATPANATGVDVAAEVAIRGTGEKAWYE